MCRNNLESLIIKQRRAGQWIIQEKHRKRRKCLNGRNKHQKCQQRNQKVGRPRCWSGSNPHQWHRKCWSGLNRPHWLPNWWSLDAARKSHFQIVKRGELTRKPSAVHTPSMLLLPKIFLDCFERITVHFCLFRQPARIADSLVTQLLSQSQALRYQFLLLFWLDLPVSTYLCWKNTGTKC